jgi:hypothetical protein
MENLSNEFQEVMKIEGKRFFKSRVRGYTPTNFIRMYNELGFKRAIEQCIGTDSFQIPDGFNILYINDCVDVTIEFWLINEVQNASGKFHRYMPLFKETTYWVAKERIDYIKFNWNTKSVK